MVVQAVGPFPGLRINKEYKKQMTLDITNTRKKVNYDNPPYKAIETTNKASRIIRGFMDQMNLMHKLNYNLPAEIVIAINKLFLDSEYDLNCLMDLTICTIKYRVNPYPLKLLNYTILYQRIQKIEITCTEIW
jgi:hypothetical protein